MATLLRFINSVCPSWFVFLYPGTEIPRFPDVDCHSFNDAKPRDKIIIIFFLNMEWRDTEKEIEKKKSMYVLDS